ncbi:Cytochrome P450 monooxygenase fum15 [Fusarium sp. DS 682]|nr:Cytochrome P450 monooxygenase fum15 [Fusarium sp. DS 682]
MSNEPVDLARYRSFLGVERILVISPKALAEVLTTKSYHFRKPDLVVSELKQATGMGVLLAEGSEHKFQRKALQTAFSYRHIKNLYPVFWDVAGEFAMALETQVLTEMQRSSADKGAVIDIVDWASRATLDIIGMAGMGQGFDAIQNANSELHQAYRMIFEPSRGAIFLAILRLVFPERLVNWLPVRRNKRMRHGIRVIRSKCQELIRQRKKQIRHQPAGDDSPGNDILTVALLNGGFPDEKLIDQLMTFLAAGHETTATALTWAIYILCKQPKVQTRLREEIKSHFPNPKTSPRSEKISSTTLQEAIDFKLPYLNAVCLEVLRNFAPIPLTMREATCHTTILQTTVPAGTRIILAPRVTNRDSALWGPDANNFNPDRWLSPKNGNVEATEHSKFDAGHQNRDLTGNSSATPKETQGTVRGKTEARSNYADLTFLHGPRSCIGQSFARAEFAILLATLILNFEFQIENQSLLDERNIKISRGATSRIVGGLKVRVRPIAVI